MHIAFIGIGSNLGDRQKNCEEAVRLLAQDANPPLPPFEKGGGGGIYPPYINGVIKIGLLAQDGVTKIGLLAQDGVTKQDAQDGVTGVSQDGVTKLLTKSRWYETKAVVSGRWSVASGQMTSGQQSAVSSERQPNYINGVIKIETELSPIDLLRLTQNIEAKLGRVRTGKKWEPRTIDLDILFYDDLVMDTPELIIPHPELHKRMFVLEPLCDIDPMLIHPVLNKTLEEIYEDFHRQRRH